MLYMLPDVPRQSLFPYLDPAPLPQAISKWLREFDKVVLGQEKAKQALALSLVLFEKNIDTARPERIPVLLLIGPTGSGKSLLSECVRDASPLPFTYCAVPSLSNTSYRGASLLSHLKTLTSDIPYGIMWIDEIDKLFVKNDIPHDGYKDLMQQELIGYLGAKTVSVNGTGEDSQLITGQVQMNQILFIFSGAFVGLDRIVAKRLGKKEKGLIGFGRCSEDTFMHHDLLAQVNHDDLISYGIMPELAGRIGSIASLKAPTSDDFYVYIIRHLQSERISKYINLLQNNNRSIEFTDEAIRTMATIAEQKSLGYRGIDHIIHTVMEQAIFSMKWHTVCDREVVEVMCK